VAARAPDTVHRLRLHLGTGTPRAEAPRWLHRTASLMGRADLRPPGLAPSAVLLVRALSVPLPRMALEPGGFGARAGWERAMRERLAEALRRAVRGERGRVPTGAEAVLFEDAAEWLACTALSLGGAPQWWWPAALRSPPVVREEAWARHLCAEARYVPALVTRLADWRCLEEGVRTVPETEAVRVLQAVAGAFGVRYSPPKVPSPEASPVRPEGLSASAAPSPPQALPQQAYPRLTYAQGRLAAGSLALYRMPGRVRALGFPLPEASPPEGESSRPDLRFGPTSEARRPGPSTPRPPPDLPLPPALPDPPARLAEGVPPAAPREASAEASAKRPLATPQPPPLPTPSAQTPETSGAPPGDLPQAPPPSALSRPFPEGIPTRLAGVLYLLNPLISLNLPEAFAAWRRQGDLGLWGLLEAVARALLGGTDAEDPLWEALAALDGRAPDTAPGAGVLGRPEVTLPSAWRDDLAEGTGVWCWASRRGRLRVWSDLGVPLAYVPRDAAAPSTQARRLLDWREGSASRAPLRRRPAAEAPLGPLPEGIDPALGPWLAVVVPFLRWRLRLALGDTSLDEVLRSPGRLVVTSSHVDLVQPMAAVSLAARRAGLDRDPGWLPEAGRVVLFHFEAEAS
jgi:hypothetical protein